MELNHNVSQRLEQKLGLSLKAQQALKLLQLNSMEITAELEEIVQANPLLEMKREDYELIEGKSDLESSPEDEENTEDGDLYSLPENNSIYMKPESTDRDGWDFDRIEAQQPTFREILRDFAFYILDDDLFSLFEILLDYMDDLGMLTEDLEKIARENHCSVDGLSSVISTMRDGGFDGIFASSREEIEALLGPGLFPSSGYSDGAFVRYVEPDLYIEFIDEKFIVTVRDYSLVLSVDE